MQGFTECLISVPLTEEMTLPKKLVLSQLRETVTYSDIPNSIGSVVMNVLEGKRATLTFIPF